VLQYVPSIFAPWKAEVLAQRKKDIKMYTGLVDDVKERMAAGVLPDCFARHVLEEQHNLDMTDLEIAYAAGSPFGAGVETVWSLETDKKYNNTNIPKSAGSLASFLLACVRFGDSFIPKAQEELDRVVGSDRLPTFEDLPSLEYVRAIVSETLRWRPVAVLGGTPHATTADDTYRGMFIPKGSTVIAPLWSSKWLRTTCLLKRARYSPFPVHLNEANFPEPHEFRPQRFLEPREYPGNFGHSAFGWGRRICPGMHLGGASVAINVARILWAFDVKPAVDTTGKKIDVDM
jgi:hypothetical protein